MFPVPLHWTSYWKLRQRVWGGNLNRSQLILYIQGMRVVLWVKPQSLGLADQRVGGSNPHDRVSSRCSVPAPAHLAVWKHVKVQVDKWLLLRWEGKRRFRALLWFARSGFVMMATWPGSCTPAPSASNARWVPQPQSRTRLDLMVRGPFTFTIKHKSDLWYPTCLTHFKNKSIQSN